jgi:serine/threonine protein kinase
MYSVITYVLLCGSLPFWGKSHFELFKMIKRGKVSFDPLYWTNISRHAKAFISKMLVVNPKHRASIQELLQDEWIVSKKDELSCTHLSTAVDELRRLNHRRKLKGVVSAVSYRFYDF